MSDDGFGDHLDCPADKFLFDFTGINAAQFSEFVSTGADDFAVGDWVWENSKVKQRREIIHWNNNMRGLRLSEIPIEHGKAPIKS